MSIEERIEHLEGSTTALLDAVSTRKAVLDNAVDTAEAAKAVATSKAAEATTVVADASTHATNASNSATQAAASAASASQIVTGVATGLPNIRPSLNLDFVNSKRVDPRIDFTRSTTATYYDGKTTVKAEENLFKNSQDYSSLWNILDNLEIEADTAIAPDGTTTASTLTESTTQSNASRMFQQVTFISETNYTISVYAKYIDMQYIGLLASAGPSLYADALFDIQNGTIGETSTVNSNYSISNHIITDVGNGWYRCSVTVTGAARGTQITVHASNGVAGPYGNNYTGTGRTVYIWGAQLEQRDSVTAYTPTTDSPITNYVPVLQTAGINEPRLDHDPVTGECKGLLMEGSRTNLVEDSQSFNITTWWYNRNLINRLENIAIAPDGTLTAGKVVPLQGGTYGMAGSPAVGVEGTTYTVSAFYKSDGSEFDRVIIGGAFGSESATFDFTTGEFISTQSNVLRTSAVDVGNGWWRLAVTYVFQNAIGNNSFYLIMCKPTTSTSISSYGYNGVYIWGMQFEQAYYPSSYIPTNGAAVTRSGDIASISAETLNYHPTEGTIVFDGESGYPHGIPVSRYAFVVNGINPNDLFLYRHGGGAAYRLGGGGISMYFNDEDISAHHRHVVSYSGNNDLVYYADTGFVSSDTSLVLPTNVTRIKLGSTSSSTSQYGGWIKGFSYYPQRITNTEAEALAATI